MFAFDKKINILRNTSGSIVLSERSDTNLEHQGYSALKPVSKWEGSVKKDRHNSKSNYLYCDGHAKSRKFEETVGDRTEDQNEHFIKEYLASYCTAP